MKVYSQLIKAKLENVTSNPTAANAGLIQFHTTNERVLLDTGSAIRELPFCVTTSFDVDGALFCFDSVNKYFKKSGLKVSGAYVAGILHSDANGLVSSSAIVNADVSGTAAIDATKIANGNVSNTEFQALDGVTATPTASKIPIASGTGKLDSWITSATTSAVGIVQLSNTYNGTSQTLATTEKALADGLGTKQNALTNPVTGSGAGVSGQLAYMTGANAIASSANYTYDATSGTLIDILSSVAAQQARLTLTNASGDKTYFSNFGVDSVGSVFGVARARNQIWQMSPNTGFAMGTISNTPMTFGTNSTAAMTIDTAQKVGIGISNPDATFQVNTALSTNSSANYLTMLNTGTSNVGLRIKRTGGTAADWYMYLDAGGTSLKFNNVTDLITLTSTGLISTVGSLKTATSLVIEDPGAGTNTVAIQAPTLAGSYVLTLPVDDGTANQVLKTDGSGVLSWADPSSGTGIAVSKKTSSTTALITDTTLLIDATSGAVEITLPVISADAEIKFIRIDTSANEVKITGNTGQSIMGDGSIYLERYGDSVMLIADGADNTNWYKF